MQQLGNIGEIKLQQRMVIWPEQDQGMSLNSSPRCYQLLEVTCRSSGSKRGTFISHHPSAAWLRKGGAILSFSSSHSGVSEQPLGEAPYAESYLVAWGGSLQWE